MPKTIGGKPVNETWWNKAKKLAADQGRAEDYEYIMGIYKRMSGISKSRSGSKMLALIRTASELLKAHRGETKSSHKYIKRTGAPGKYQYVYADEQGKLHTGSMKRKQREMAEKRAAQKKDTSTGASKIAKGSVVTVEGLSSEYEYLGEDRHGQAIVRKLVAGGWANSITVHPSKVTAKTTEEGDERIAGFSQAESNLIYYMVNKFKDKMKESDLVTAQGWVRGIGEADKPVKDEILRRLQEAGLIEGAGAGRIAPQEVRDNLLHMTKQHASAIARNSGYLDVKWDKLEFESMGFEGDGEFTAQYKGYFTDEGEDYMGRVFITWHPDERGKKEYSLSFSGQAELAHKKQGGKLERITQEEYEKNVPAEQKPLQQRWPIYRPSNVVDSDIGKQLSRKPVSLDDISDLEYYSQAASEFVNKLPVITPGEIFNGKFNKDRIDDNFAVKVPQWFVLAHGGEHYLVDTEGDNYIRYAAKLDPEKYSGAKKSMSMPEDLKKSIARQEEFLRLNRNEMLPVGAEIEDNGVVWVKTGLTSWEVK